MEDEKRIEPLKPSHSVLVRVKQGQARETERCFTNTFLIGRHEECDLQIKDTCVSKVHVKIIFEAGRWWIRDLESANGTYLNDVRIQRVPLLDEAELELGKGGPAVWLKVQKEETCEVGEEEVSKGTGEFASATQIIQRFFSKSLPKKVGEQTMMFRRAFERVHKKRSRKYRIIIGISIFLLLASGGMILYQKARFDKLRNTAVDMFYAMKSLELQIALLEETIMVKADPKQVRELMAKRERLKELEKGYDHFVEELGLYKKMREEDRIILRVTRLFGECEVNVPEGFVKEVSNYIKKWKGTDRLKKGIDRAKEEGYTPAIISMMIRNNLPPHFFFLALQESNFESSAVGPKTKYGYAKGIWQFIPLTAKHYGLKIGPLYKEKVYDPKDERFHFEKATQAAIKYIKDIHNTLAQASGLLVMASYNWSETKVRDILRSMPESPRERNFWRLLAKETIPRDTYDYVFYIFSAAVICENPRLFGFDFDGPVLRESG